MSQEQANLKSRKTLSAVLIGLITLAALLGRAYKLDYRPMHTDEAVHAIKFIDLLDHGRYHYDPHEYHGPTLYFFSLPLVWLRGQTRGIDLDETTLRLVCVAASGLFFVPLFFMVGRADDWGIVLASAVGALSPIAVYLSRYFIHEVFLVAFVFMWLVFAWRYAIARTWGWAVAAGASFGLALATKETIALSVIAVIVALALVFMTEPEWRKNWREWLDWKLIGIGLGTTLLVIIVFYSSFFTHPAGVLDFCKTYFFYLDRAGGQGHEKPWYYYFSLLFYYHKRLGFTGSEAYVLVAASVVGVCSFMKPFQDRKARIFLKFLFVYSSALMAIYSCIPYKMPWLALNWMQPMSVLAGFGIAWLLGARSLALRATTIVVSLLAAYHFAYQIYRENGRFRCDDRNPYVYSHTSTDFLRMPKLLKDLSALHADRADLHVQVISDEYWPLPWYTREFNQVGYWHQPPERPLAPVLVTSVAVAEELETKLHDYTGSIFGLRSGVILMVYTRNDLWEKYLDTRRAPHAGR